VLFRADTSHAIGTGHGVRCLALASELGRRGINSLFASRQVGAGENVGPIWNPSIEVVGSAAAEIATIRQHAGSLGRGHKFGALILDHYGLGADWLDEARGLTSRRLVIDDLIDRRLPCELLVNSNPGIEAGAYDGLLSSSTRLLLGHRFALVRSAFRKARIGGRPTTGPVRSVLVSMGGSDPYDATMLAIRATKAALPAAMVEVVLGPLYAGAATEASGIRIHRAIDAEAMAELMLGADLAIGAGGTSSWERCALGLPTAVVSLAHNQLGLARHLEAAGVARNLGPVEDIRSDGLASEIRQLASDSAARRSMRDRAWELVDARGVERVAHHLEGVSVRSATDSDAELLWRWANDPETREASFRSDPIPFRDHVRWLSQRLADPSVLLVVAENSAGALGQVRFESRGSDTEVSISIAPDHRGVVGGLVLASAIRRFRRRSPRDRLFAKVKFDNERSRQLFEGAGFQPRSERDGILIYDGPPFRSRHALHGQGVKT
jgi:UDP-2,4-diacetamido-2,4,6-trideoxy-beta-L-altropyranose hydrolase